MSNYNPDEGAILAPPWTTVDLSHRDVSLRIPLDAVTEPGVSLSAACFGNGVYEINAAKKCISNLIAVGYRRLHVDLYWSPTSSQWGFCPVAIPSGKSPLPTSSMSSVPHASLSTGRITAVDPLDSTASESPSETASSSDISEAGEKDRRDASVSLPAASSVMPAFTSVATPSDVTTTESSSGATLYNLGSYSCSPSLDIKTLISILIDYYEGTKNTLDANILSVVFHVHAASAAKSPDEPAQAPPSDQLPVGLNSIATLFDSLLGTSIYGPRDLSYDRAHLNRWYEVDLRYRPVDEYLATETTAAQGQNGAHSWPPEGVVEMVRGKRLLLGWGGIDPQMKAYDLNENSGVVFRPGVLSSPIKVATTNGRIQSGCLFSSETTDIKDVPYSWTTAELPKTNSSEQLSSLSLEFASCGISPLVNTTLLNMTADVDIEPYRNISLSAVWSWHPGQPYNSSNIYSGEFDGSHVCAVMDLALSGQWRSTNCDKELYAACRVESSPYSWTTSTRRVTYAGAWNACPPGSTFAVPRTGLENTYLYSHLMNQPKSVLDNSSGTSSKREVFLDFNSIDVPTCWVSNGPKARCPYETNESELERRTIVIPTIAAIIVLVITALTLFVKCNANRRNSRRKRIIEGWEYEGVPS